MTIPRAQHTATLLNDGRVLLAGGDCTNSPETRCDTAEIYDPVTKQFTRTGSLRQGRARHAATLLPDGRVLITGGHYLGQGVLLVELYDPQTGRFAAIGSLRVAREFAFAALLEDGRVVLGGQDPAEFFDLRNRMPSQMPGHLPLLLKAGVAPGATPVVLPDQRILFAGGAFGFLTLYDLGANSFSSHRIRSHPWGDSNPFDSVAVLLDGRLLVTGGSVSRAFNSASNGALLYDLAGSEPVLVPAVPSMTGYRNSHTSTTLPDGKVLLYGGNEGGEMTSLNEIFDPVTLTFQEVSTEPNRASHTATLLVDGTVLIAGGSVQLDYTGENRRMLDTAVLYSPDKPIPAAQIHTAPGSSQSQGAILHAGTSRVATAQDPAEAGEVLGMFVSGLAANGMRPPRVAIGGLAAEVLSFGVAPGSSESFQVNVRVPTGVAAGPAVPVRMNYLDRPSNEVTIGVR